MSEAAPALEAPAELWVSPGEGEYAGLWVQDGPGVDDEVRYVRADLYEALIVLCDRLTERLNVVRSWNEAPCLEPLRAALEASEDNDASGAEQILRTAIKRAEAPCLEPGKSVGEAS